MCAVTRKPITHQKAVLLKPYVLLAHVYYVLVSNVVFVLLKRWHAVVECVLSRSGEVILESCLGDIVYPTMQCPITGKKLRKKDIIRLTPGGTAFSAHNKVEVSKYAPAM